MTAETFGDVLYMTGGIVVGVIVSSIAWSRIRKRETEAMAKVALLAIQNIAQQSQDLVNQMVSQGAPAPEDDEVN